MAAFVQPSISRFTPRCASFPLPSPRGTPRCSALPRIAPLCRCPSSPLLFLARSCGFLPLGEGRSGREIDAPSTLVLPLKVRVYDSDGPITDADIASPPSLQVLYKSGVGVASDVTADALPARMSPKGISSGSLTMGNGGSTWERGTTPHQARTRSPLLREMKQSM